jgi:hypothetical protein
MSIQKNKPVSNKTDLWFKIIPIVLTACGLAFGVYQWQRTKQRELWNGEREYYMQLQSLAGQIAAAKGNDSLLTVLSAKLNEEAIGKARTYEMNDSVLVMRMMMMKKDLRNTLRHKDDYYQSDKLSKTSMMLSDYLGKKINEGDRKY